MAAERSEKEHFVRVRRWIDVSMPLEEGMTVWPSDEPFRAEPRARISRGDHCNTTGLYLSTHTGTHVDAPWHFEEHGARLDDVDPAVFFGEALVVDATGTDAIGAGQVSAMPDCQRVLFKTDNSAMPVDAPFREDYVAVEPDAAAALVERGVRLVGIDYLSVAPYGPRGREAHHILLGAGVFIVEGLRLAEVAPGRCEFTVLPLPLAGLDGAPCRAFVGELEGTGA